MIAAFRRLAPPAFFGAFPLLALLVGAEVALRAGSFGLDFRGDLYPEARLVLHGLNPFPSPDVSWNGSGTVYPIPAALLVIPFTTVPLGLAVYLWYAVSVCALSATLWLLGVTDWRIYGVVALWAPTMAELQTGNLTIALALLAAVAWRLREHRVVPGVAIGLAVALKLYLWPLGVWLLVTRRFASAATAVGIAVAGTLLVLPFEGLTSYARLMRSLAAHYQSGSYSPVGLFSQAGLPVQSAHLAAWAIGLGVVALAAWRRSFSLTVAASLLLSPIVWLHYFVLLVVPLALRWPRLAWPWFLPLLFWFCAGQGAQLEDIGVGLAVFAAVVAVCESRRVGQLVTSVGRAAYRPAAA